jgi:hypothetical protein
VKLQVDVEKRDAVVAAFRVSRSCVQLLWINSIVAIARIFRIWYVFATSVGTQTYFRHFVSRVSLLERDAFGADEYHPISQKGSNLTDAGGIGYTIADSLDTIILMQQQGYNFDDEYERAKTWVRDTLNFDRDANFNTFEVCTTY